MGEEEKGDTLRIQIRYDASANLIRATFVGFGETREIATLSAWLAEHVPEAFESWKILLRDAFVRSLSVAGITHTEFCEVDPEREPVTEGESDAQ